jgi:hypothetical protein
MRDRQRLSGRNRCACSREARNVVRLDVANNDAGGGAFTDLTPGPDLAETIRNRASLVHARLRGADVMREIAFDILGLDRDSLAPRDRLAIARLIDEVAAEAADEGLQVLASELRAAIGTAPPGVRRALAFSSIKRTDFE